MSARLPAIRASSMLSRLSPMCSIRGSRRSAARSPSRATRSAGDTGACFDCSHLATPSSSGTLSSEATITRCFSSSRLRSCRPTCSGSELGRATRRTTSALSSSTVQRVRVVEEMQDIGVEFADLLLQPRLELRRAQSAGNQGKAPRRHDKGALLLIRQAAARRPGRRRRGPSCQSCAGRRCVTAGRPLPRSSSLRVNSTASGPRRGARAGRRASARRERCSSITSSGALATNCSLPSLRSILSISSSSLAMSFSSRARSAPRSMTPASGSAKVASPSTICAEPLRHVRDVVDALEPRQAGERGQLALDARAGLRPCPDDRPAGSWRRPARSSRCAPSGCRRPASISQFSSASASGVLQPGQRPAIRETISSFSRRGPTLPVSAHSSSVTKGMNGCRSFRIWSSAKAAVAWVSALRRRVLAGQDRLGQFDVPVAEGAPDEVVGGVRRFVELVVLDRPGHRGRRRARWRPRSSG